MLPDDFAPWKIVYYYFSAWKKKGVWEDIHELLVEKARVLHGKNEEPTVGIIDAQSASVQDRTGASSAIAGRRSSKFLQMAGIESN